MVNFDAEIKSDIGGSYPQRKQQLVRGDQLERFARVDGGGKVCYKDYAAFRNHHYLGLESLFDLGCKDRNSFERFCPSAICSGLRSFSMSCIDDFAF